MGIKVANNAFGTLAAGINSSATSITLTTGQGARFPSLGAGDYFYATLIDTSNNLEIVKCTARSTDVLTVVRAQESTTARAYSTGDRIEIRITAQTFEDASGLEDGEVTEAKIATGAVTSSKVASGVALANLGFTPVNKAGDTMTGVLTTQQGFVSNQNFKRALNANAFTGSVNVPTNNSWTTVFTLTDTGSTSGANYAVDFDSVSGLIHLYKDWGNAYLVAQVAFSSKGVFGFNTLSVLTAYGYQSGIQISGNSIQVRQVGDRAEPVAFSVLSYR
jgi:hypothetical protein